MTVDASQLKDRIGAAAVNADITSALVLAVDRVTLHIGAVTTVPAEVIDEATLMVGESIYRSRAEPDQSSQSSFATDGPVVVRQPRDPIAAAEEFLGPWLGTAKVGGGFA